MSSTDDGRCYISIIIRSDQSRDYTSSFQLFRAARSLSFKCVAEHKVGGAIGNLGRLHHQPPKVYNSRERMLNARIE